MSGKDLKRIREQRELSLDDVAEAVGLSASQISRFESEQREPRLKEIVGIADFLGVLPAEIYPELASLADGFKERPAVVVKKPDRNPQLPGIPVFAAAEGGKGELVISTDPLDYVTRPWYLGEVQDAYAVVVTGDSMEPAYDSADIAIINPRLSYLRGKDHIFTMKSEDGTFRAMLKRLVKATDDEWIVEQFNPPKQFALQRSEWSEAKRVVGKYSG
jgi:phage repressor protein C with HTH and peptisase S24 domain